MYTFNVGRIDVTMVIALCTGILSAAGALVGIIINKCGLRMTLLIGGLLGSCGTFVSGFATGIPFLIVTLGIVTGLGYSLVYVSALVTLGKYFPGDNNTVLVFATMGSPVGIMIFPPVFTECIAYFGWRGALMILSGICLNSFVFTLLMTPPESTVQMHKTETEEKKGNTWFDFTIFRSKTYILYVVVLCVISGSATSALITLPDIIRTRGYTSQNAAFFLSVESIADIVGRILVPVCIQRLTSQILFYAASIFFAASLILFPSLTGRISLYSGTCFIGITAGIILSIYNLVVLDIIGSEKYATAMGFAETMCGIGNIILGAVVGSVGEATHSFDSSIRILGLASMTVCGIALFMQIVCWRITCKKDSPAVNEEGVERGECNEGFTSDHKNDDETKN